VTILTLTTLTLSGQTVKKCDTAVLLMTSEKVGKLKQNEIRDFLLTFGKECRNNAEFSEWSNELLFSVLDKQTELTLATIEKEEKQIEIDEILTDLGSPINDMIDVKKLIPKVEKVKFNGRLKKNMIEKLKTADNNLNWIGVSALPTTMCMKT
jgi:hypothetical protein